jgi:hypothetical protein
VFTFREHVAQVRARLQRVPGVASTRVFLPGPAARRLAPNRR